MSVLTFRVNVPNGTTARNPVIHKLISGASALHSVMIWTPQVAGMDKRGYQLVNRSGVSIIPEIGSHDAFAFGDAEDGWASVPTQPHPIPLFDAVIEGPPYILEFRFYNIDAAAVLIGGFAIVREPMAHLAQEAMIYEFLTARAPEARDISPETKTILSSEKKSGADTSKVKINMQAFLKDNNPLVSKTNLKVEKK